jgi:hypothetical protein
MNDVLASGNRFQPQRQAQQGGLLVGRKRGDALQLADQRKGMGVNGVQDSLPWVQGGSSCLSGASASGSDADNLQIILC